MADDIIGGFFKGVDKFLGGTGGEPSTTPVQSVDEYGGIIEQSPVIPEARVEPVIHENQTIVTASKDEMGEYKPTSMDTSTPIKQSFVESYVDSAKTGSIDRIGYIKPEDIGDSKTQELVRQGYSPLQAASMQRDEKIAELVGKGYSQDQAAQSKEARYYANEAKKAADSVDAMSASYHHDAMKSGLPQDPNPFEHAGDLARQFGYKIEGVSNIPGTKKDDPLLVPFKGSFLEDANIITKTQRTGEMGDYGNLKDNTFSSGIGILDLSTKQAIARTAAASALASGKEGPQSGWVVDEHAMDKYTPALSKGAGFNLAYKEAKLQDITGGGGGGGSDKNISKVTEDISKGTLTKGENIMLPFGLGDTGISKGSGKSGENIMLPFGLGDTGISKGTGSGEKKIVGAGIGGAVAYDSEIKSPGITKDTLKDYLLPEDMVYPGKDLASVEKVGTGLVSTKSLAQGSDIVIETPNVSGGSRKVDMTVAPASNWANRMSGGRIGGDVSLGGLPLYGRETGSGLLYRLPTPRGSAMDTGTFFRVAKKSKQHVNIKPTPKKVSSFYRVTNEQIIPQTIGKEFFKFKVGSPTTSARPSQIANFNKINIGISDGLKTSKGAASTIKMPKLRSVDNSTLNKGSKMSVNVNSIMKKMTVKKLKVK